MDCPACHAEDFPVFTSRSGPHGGYTATTQKCEVCHTVHAAPAGSVLLPPKPTVLGTCRHCHDDSRIVGEPGAVVPARVYRYGDGQTSADAGTDDPLFQCFPHETQNYRMLVEAAVTAYSDDLCLNYHPLAQLP